MTDSAARILRLFDPRAVRRRDSGPVLHRPRTPRHRRDVHDGEAGRHRRRTHGDRRHRPGHALDAHRPEVVRLEPVRRRDHSPSPASRARATAPAASACSWCRDCAPTAAATRSASTASGQARLEVHRERRGDPRRGVRDPRRPTHRRIPADGRDAQRLRLSNAMRATALMRRAVRESVDHTRVRHVFGKPLFDQPLMRATLLPMILDTEAALHLVIEAAARLTEADGGDADARALVRVLTPLAKHTRASGPAPSPARPWRSAAATATSRTGSTRAWCATPTSAPSGRAQSNVIALDVLRCARRQQAHTTLADTPTATARPPVTAGNCSARRATPPPTPARRAGDADRPVRRRADAPSWRRSCTTRPTTRRAPPATAAPPRRAHLQRRHRFRPGRAAPPRPGTLRRAGGRWPGPARRPYSGDRPCLTRAGADGHEGRVDLSKVLAAGPYVTMSLADLGADVIKVDAPRRRLAWTRSCPPFSGPRRHVLPGRQPQQALGDPRPQVRGRPGGRAPHARRRSGRQWWRTSAPAPRWPGSSTTSELSARYPRLVILHISAFGDTGRAARRARLRHGGCPRRARGA